jgi:predicted enzyme related to lactoylglutathione lyase
MNSRGLATVIYYVPNLAEAKAWYARVFGHQPYFDMDFYVGFNIQGYELGLHPETDENKAGSAGCVAYWRVPVIEPAIAHCLGLGAQLVSDAQDVGEGIKVATVSDPFGNPIGLIENPHFKLPVE